MQFKEYPAWQMIDNFPFNEPNSVETYYNRLARYGNWTEEQMQEIVEEYKKFLFLCATKPFLIVPPKIVDLAWSLHMEYYPMSFRDLYRIMPGHWIKRSRGEKGENDDPDWLFDHYLQSRKIYQETFGDRPPAWIWGMYENEFEEDYSTRIHLGKRIFFAIDARLHCLIIFITGFLLTIAFNHFVPVIAGILSALLFFVTNPALNKPINQVVDGKGYRGYLN
ncbi:hypothetical protein [Pseudoflavitalea rhizosphaerae]|uniref:hypothetical protein n=1 Tax=Pseudoflavitalea rhizosphaerae TaxID=1884793 RepID=UPI000F8F4998|nr:hypothetical protein [Pseudoflavitalea rhizosphaerae]